MAAHRQPGDQSLLATALHAAECIRHICLLVKKFRNVGIRWQQIELDVNSTESLVSSSLHGQKSALRFTNHGFNIQRCLWSVALLLDGRTDWMLVTGTELLSALAMS